MWEKLRAEVVISKEVDREKVSARVGELTKDFDTISWKPVTEDDMQQAIDRAYSDIGDI